MLLYALEICRGYQMGKSLLRNGHFSISLFMVVGYVCYVYVVVAT